MLRIPRRLLSFLFMAPALFAASESVDPLRLTHEVEPLAQAVELTLDPGRDALIGRTTVDLVAHAAFSSFRLHAQGPVFATATLTDPAGHAASLKAATTEPKIGLVTLTAAQELPAGDYRLAIEFTAPFQRDGSGLYKTTSRGDAYLFTQFEPSFARKAFPCWDEPEFKIPWQLTLKIPAALEAVANTPVALESHDATWKILAFGRTPPMPSYLVALTVGPLEFVSVPGLSVPGRIVTPRGQAAQAAEAARLAPPLLARLERYFGVPYPYAKLDQLAVPEYIYGAMENAGLITYVDRLLLMNPDHPSFVSRRHLANVMAHEMSHMWFGDLVTMRWWDDLWLNESFADWMCAKIVDEQFPEFRIRIQQSLDVRNAMRSDALPSIAPVRRHANATSDVDALVDELTYDKGKGILNMVENWMGPDKFRAAIQTYFLKHRWGNTTANDLWEVFGTASGDDIAGMLSAFIEQPGLPLVSFALEADGRLRISQERFHNLGAPTLPGQWHVPVVFAWSKEGVVHRERVLLDRPTQVLSVPGLATADWIHPNAGEAGYYRWALSPELEARLARQASRLSPIERIGLLDNAEALLNTGRLDGRAYLACLSAFAQDEDPDVTQSIVTALETVRTTFVTPASEPAFGAFRRTLLRPALDRIGLQPRPGEPSPLGALRAALYVALGEEQGDPDVAGECRRLASQCLENPESVDPGLRESALKVAAYHGDAALFDRIVAAFEQPQSPAVRGALIRALGSFHDAALAQRALDYSLTRKLNATEFFTIYSLMGRDPVNYALLTDWIIAHYAAIAAKAPALYTAELISVTTRGSDFAPFERLREFLLAPSRKTEFAEINITKATEHIAFRKELRAKEAANVEASLLGFSK